MFDFGKPGPRVPIGDVLWPKCAKAGHVVTPYGYLEQKKITKYYIVVNCHRKYIKVCKLNKYVHVCIVVFYFVCFGCFYVVERAEDK